MAAAKPLDENEQQGLGARAEKCADLRSMQPAIATAPAHNTKSGFATQPVAAGLFNMQQPQTDIGPHKQDQAQCTRHPGMQTALCRDHPYCNGALRKHHRELPAAPLPHCAPPSMPGRGNRRRNASLSTCSLLMDRLHMSWERDRGVGGGGQKNRVRLAVTRGSA